MAYGGIIGQLTDAFTKAQTLSSTTAGLYGLGTNAVPDNVFAFLGKYNQYWWSRRTILPYEINFGPLEDQPVILRGGASNSWSVPYSAEIEVRGNIATLKDQLTLSVSYNGYETANQLKGKYFIVYNASIDIKEIAYVPMDAPDATRSLTGGNYEVFIQGKKIESITPPITGDWEYVQSSDRNAYPDSGEQDGYEYQYLGIPFENAVGAPKIETGSYVGTGTFGDSNPNVITLSFNPKIVVIYAKRRTEPIQASNYPADIMFLPFSNGLSGSYVSSNYQGTFNWYFGDSTSSKNITHVSFVGNKLSWVGESSTAQANITGDEYFYIAIG